MRTTDAEPIDPRPRPWPPAPTDERPDAPEPPSLTDPAAAEREIASFVRETVDDGRSVDDTAAALRIEPEAVARFANPVERAEHERIPPLTPTDRAFLFGGGGR